ncbi:MAG TPA: PP2C family protein-serine/threonine phosphatase, partial [bacterium]|nr:PP2C family protein-serine/threonine phosphatase [bacterium]
AGTMECWNAGHDPLLVLRANGQLESVNPDGMILGVVRGVLFPSITVPLEPGDTALLFTDGLPESMDPVRNLFGEHRIERVLRETQGQPAQAVLEALLAAARRFAAGTPQHDDTTLIVLRATGTPRAAGPAVPTLQTQESRA